jgi:drug/metabolite transporter (DMT)-like permease
MLTITACIVINALLIIVFKLFPKYNIQTFQAIVANYYVAGLLGFMLAERFPSPTDLTQSTWGLHILFLGFLFVSLFYLIAVTTREMGVAVASVSNKMSVVIPVTLAIILYNEKITAAKISGVALAVASVVLVSFKKSDNNQPVSRSKFLLPVVLFIGCGMLDSLINYIQNTFVNDVYSNEFLLSTGFLVAGILGSLFLVTNILSGKVKPDIKSIITGLLLGVPNFFSMYLIMKSLELKIIEDSVFFPINNIGVVVLSTLVSALFLHEKLSVLNKIGVATAILAIYIIAFI